MTVILKLSDRNLKTASIKKALRRNYNLLETNEKVKTQQTNRRHKEKNK